MGQCEKCRKELVEDKDAGHTFCGYGFYIEYCHDCCPREFDGMCCDEPHDDDDGGNDG